MMIEFIETGQKTGTVDAFERLCKFCDEQMSKAVLGQTTTTDALSQGLAGNQAHDEVRGDIARSDAKQLAATLNTQLIPAIIALNYGPRAVYPRITIGRAEAVDLDKLSSVADRAVRMGLKISHKALVEQLGLTPAEDEDDTITLPESVSPMEFNPGFASVHSRHHQDCVTAAAHSHAPDMIERLSDEMAETWEEIMDPVVLELEEAIASAETFEDLSAKLLEITQDLDMDNLSEKLAQAMFAARLAGNLKINPAGGSS